MNLNKSIGRAFETVTVVQELTELGEEKDNFKPGENTKLESYQHRVNSLYMPALPCSNTEKYMNVMQIKENSIYTYSVFDASALVVQQLQRHDFIGITSGLSINSSSSLRLTMNFKDVAAVPERRARQYTSFMKIIKPYLYDKVVISV